MRKAVVSFLHWLYMQIRLDFQKRAIEGIHEGNLPVIVSTDAKLKKDKYEHIGMNHVNTRTLGEKSFMYDLVREV